MVLAYSVGLCIALHTVFCIDLVLETAVLRGLETARDRNFAVLLLKNRSWLSLRPINNLLACMRRKINVVFAQVNNKDCNL